MTPDVSRIIRHWVRQVLINGHLDQPLEATDSFDALVSSLEEDFTCCSAEEYRDAVMAELDRQRLFFERAVHAIKFEVLEVPV